MANPPIHRPTKEEVANSFGTYNKLSRSEKKDYVFKKNLLKKEVYNALCQSGVTNSNLQVMINEDYWDIGWKPTSKNGARHIIEEVKKEIKQDWLDDKKYLKSQLYSNFLNIYNECMSIGNHQVALNAMKEIGKLAGAYEQLSAEQNIVNNQITIDFNLPQIEEKDNNIEDADYEEL